VFNTALDLPLPGSPSTNIALRTLTNVFAAFEDAIFFYCGDVAEAISDLYLSITNSFQASANLLNSFGFTK